MCFESIENRFVLIAKLQIHLGAPRYDAVDSWVEFDLADGPHAALSRVGGERVIDRVRQFDQRVPSVSAQGHWSGAGVVLLPLEGHLEIS